MKSTFTPVSAIPTNARENYSSLDGLRAYAAIGIVLMHVRANIAIKPSDNIVTSAVIPWFTNFTLLFMLVSAFSMCCGYYERVKSGAITPAKFYAKRYHRTWPFFAMMVCICFVMEPSWSTFCQSFADLTMCFNLLPNPEIEVIGVGWFLGTVFTFYMLFPFFTFLLDNKKRGWMVLGLSLVFSYIAIDQFNIGSGFGRKNIINSAPFFISGGMIYLYRKGIKDFLQSGEYAALGKVRPSTGRAVCVDLHSNIDRCDMFFACREILRFSLVGKQNLYCEEYEKVIIL